MKIYGNISNLSGGKRFIKIYQTTYNNIVIKKPKK